VLNEDWYTATEDFLETMSLNPAHAEGAAALANCYYELGEYSEALVWVQKARELARADLALANLEAEIDIALGRLDDAEKVLDSVLAKEPYNKEALFAASELDIARGRTSDALTRFQNAVKRYSDDRRLLLSLALVLGSTGNQAAAQSYIERAIQAYPGDWRVYYYAAYLSAEAGNLNAATGEAQTCLKLKPGYSPAISLLAALYYRQGSYAQAVDASNALISLNRQNASAWYLKGMAQKMQGQTQDAITTLSTACSINPDDEFARAALEDLIMTTTTMENPLRPKWAAWHFAKAANYIKTSLLEQALYEYKRGLRINPYAKERLDYASLLNTRGFPEMYLAQLVFMQKQNPSAIPKDQVQKVQDTVEAYTSAQSSSLANAWKIDPVDASGKHWKLALFSVGAQSAFYHVDAGLVAASLAQDVLRQSRNIDVLDLNLAQPSFAAAFRAARTAGADYFLLFSAQESAREVSLKGSLYVASTGSTAASFQVYRSGDDRLRASIRSITDQLEAALPLRAVLLKRNGTDALIDKGRADGVTEGHAAIPATAGAAAVKAVPPMVFDVIKAGSLNIAAKGLALDYAPSDVLGSFTVTRADEELSQGTLKRNGWFDTMTAGDDLVLQPAKPAAAASKTKKAQAPVSTTETVNPELRDMLRSLR
jgi:tetratricopeptide (TPR) repeat protein